MPNRIFYYGLTASLFLHFAVIICLSLWAARAQIFYKSLKKIEVTYHEIKNEREPVQDAAFKEVNVIKQPPRPRDVDVVSRKMDMFPSMVNTIKDISKVEGKIDAPPKKNPEIKTLDIGRKITVPLLKAEKITNPKYLDYNQSIRAKIKQRAYSYVRHPGFESGEVYLTFVLASSGALSNIKVISGKTSANADLIGIGRSSVEESAPFPPFPEDLNYPELTFNVIISFEVVGE
jgi:hypothetical protein